MLTEKRILNVEEKKELQLVLEKLSIQKDNDILIKAIEAHYRLVTIHPFTDGNGRTARLLLNAILLQNGYAPIIIRTIDRKRYLTALETYQVRENNEPYYNFMLSSLNRSLKMMIALLDVNQKEPSKDMLTIAKFAKLVGVPVSTIRYWMKEGKIKPIAYTASSYALFEESQKSDVMDLIKK